MSSWQKVFDETSQQHYYWNPATQETTWDPPAQDTPAPTTATPATPATPDTQNNQAPSEDYYKSKEYYDWYMANALAASQPQQPLKQDRFQDLAATLDYAPQNQQGLSAKAFRQMSMYFDTEKYQRDRHLDRLRPKEQKKYTKKELDKFKQKKIEKKRKSLLDRMGPDL